MRIVFVTNMCTHYVRQLFELLAGRYDVEFYFTGGHESYWHKPNQIQPGNFKGTYLKGLLLPFKVKLTPLLLRLPWREYDVVIKTIDDRFALLAVFMAAKIWRKPFILWTGLWAHPQTLTHRLSFGFTQFIYQHSDAIVTYGEHVRRYLIDLNIDERKIFSAPHATDNGVYNRPVPGSEKVELKQKLGLVPEAIVILYVGRLEDGKGLEYLMKAMSGLNQATLLCVGSGSKQADLRAFCKDKGIEAVFAGHVPNEFLYLYYSIGDVFILPSVTTPHFKEPWGMVINEAMNQACAVVTTTAVGAAAGGLVEDGKTGFIVEEKNSAALAGALRVLCADQGLRQRMGEAGRLKIASWTPQQAAQGFAHAVDYVLGLRKRQ